MACMATLLNDLDTDDDYVSENDFEDGLMRRERDDEYFSGDDFELNVAMRREHARRPMTAAAILKYKFDRRLGGTAYLARETNIRKDWRIVRKLKSSHFGTTHIDDVMHQITERRAMFDHPHLIQITDLFVADNTVYIVDEYCQGGTLGALVTRAKRHGEHLNEIEVLDWLVQMLRAVDHLQKKGIAHGSIATGNIFLKNNNIKLGETKQGKEFIKNPEMFRLLHGNKSDPCAHDPSEGHVTAAEMTYYSPEVIQGAPYTHKADVWSVGCVLYELCSQSRIFNGGNLEETCKMVTGHPSPQFPAFFSLDLANVWRKLMVKDVEKRLRAEEVLDLPFMQEHIKDMEESQQAWEERRLEETGGDQ